MTETSRSAEYIELFFPARNESYRLAAKKMELKGKNGWTWAHNGHWEDSGASAVGPAENLERDGQTSGSSSLTEEARGIVVTSATFGSGKSTEIRISNKRLQPATGMISRGLYVVALVKGEIAINKVYDCLGKADAANQFADAINQLPNGALVIVVVNDEATQNFNRKAQDAIVSIGGKIGLLGKPFRSSYYCIGKKGLREGMAIEAIGAGDTHYPR